MGRMIRAFCGKCKKEMYQGEYFIVDSDKDGNLKKIYHTGCVDMRSEVDAKKRS